MKIGFRLLAFGVLAACSGCATYPVWFEPSSSPVPQSGYTVCGSEVFGTCEQYWVFGLGGSASGSDQSRALREAMGKAPGADAIINMAVDVNKFVFPPFFMRTTTRVTGIPVKFNPVK